MERDELEDVARTSEQSDMKRVTLTTKIEIMFAVLIIFNQVLSFNIILLSITCSSRKYTVKVGLE